MSVLSLVISGSPIAKKRPRFSSRGKFVRVYSDQAKEKRQYQLLLAEQYNEPPILGPVHILFNFVMPRPKNHWGTGRNKGKLRPSAPEHHIVKPDFDNLEKFILDAMNGLIFKDDSQVCIAKSFKRYQEVGEIPHTAVKVSTP